MSANEVFDTETQTWIKQEGDAAGRTEVTIAAVVEGSGVATEAKQDEQIARMPAIAFAPGVSGDPGTPVYLRENSVVVTQTLGIAAASSAALNSNQEGIPVRTYLDGLVEGTPDRLRSSLGYGALGEGAPGHLGTLAYPISIRGADTAGSSQQLALDRTRADDYHAARLTDGTDFIGTVTSPVRVEIVNTLATFYAVFDRVAPAANKYMATIFNTSASRIARINRIWVYNWQVGAVTGVLLDQELRRISARTMGVAVTPVAGDSGDTLSAGITADTASTVVTEVTDALYQRIIAYSEEATLAQGYVTGREQDAGALQYERPPWARGIVLRQNEGITIKNITSSTVGSVSYVFEFTDEAA